MLRTALIGSSMFYTTAQAVTFSDVQSGVFNGNSSGHACTTCHAVSSPNRFAAPVGANFDTYANSVLDSSCCGNKLFQQAASYGSSGYMPWDSSTGSSVANDLNTTEQNLLNNWSTQGAPFSAPVGVTGTATSMTKTTATLNGTADPNVYVGTPVPGTAYYQYGIGNYSSTSATTSGLDGLSAVSVPRGISNLLCGSEYQFRIRATNGHDTTGDTDGGNTFETDYCTTPTLQQDVGGTYSVNEGASVDMVLEVTDPDPGTITWSIETDGTKGSASVIGGATTSAPVTNGQKTIRYTASGNNFGADTVTVRVTSTKSGEDGGADDNNTATITVNININDQPDPPVISVSGSTISLNEDNSASANATTSAATVSGSLSLSASDPDDSPTYHWDVSSAGSGTANFSVSTGASPTLTYTPVQNAFGTGADSFTIRVCDGGSAGSGNCDTQVLSVNLTARPDDPVAVADPSATVSQGDTTDINVTANDSDPDNVAEVLTPINIASVSSNLTSATVVGQNIRVTHDGSATPSTASLQYTVQDSTGRTDGPVLVTITITGVNFPPTANSTSQNVDEGTSFVFDLPNLDNTDTYSSDPEDDTLTVSSLTCTSCPNASVSVIASGPDSGKVQYTHDGTNVTGGEMDTFTFAVDDPNVGNGPSNTATITVNLQPVNDLPVGINDAFTVDEGGSFDMTGSDTLDTGPNNTSLFDNDTDEENGTGSGMSLGSNTAPTRSSTFSVNASGEVVYDHDGSETTGDSFTYVVNDGTADAAGSATVSIIINPVNDQPAISTTAPVGTYTEDAAGSFTYDVNATDVDIVNGNDTLTFSLQAGQTGDMSINGSSGLITWTPERTGTFNDSSKSVTVRVTDNDESTSGTNILFAEQTFSITTSPPDGDADGIPDYVDNCLGVANADQADLDGDTRDLGGSVLITSATPSSLTGYPNLDVDHTSRDPLNALSESYLRGGDACDEDVDGDGISKAFEDSVPYLSDTDAADALLDEDGDGVMNGDEFLAGTDPAVDSVGPSITAPADITVDATGYLTVVDVGEAVAIDGNEGAVLSVIPAVNPNPAIDTNTMDCSILANFPAEVEPFRPGLHVITWITCDSAGNLAASSDQTVIVRPLVSVTSGQNVGEGQTAVVDVSLNGAAPAYPVNVSYSVGGLSDPNSDHDAADGIIIITNPDIEGNTPGTVGRLDVNIATDMQTELFESIIINLDSATNAAISSADTHTIAIVETNVAPEVEIDVVQGSETMGSVIFITTTTPALAGNVVLTADTYDANDPGGTGLTFTWTDAGIGTAANDTLTIDPSTLSAGVYPVSVEVDDGELVSTASIELVAVAAEPTLTGVDSDGDGNDDATEGAGDDDRDGIPNYLDDESLPGNVVQNQTASTEDVVFLETELGLSIATGTTSRVAARNGAVVTGADIESFGGTGGGAGSSDTGYTLQGSYYDFEISGLKESQTSVNVVIPLPIAMLPDAEYRKFDGTSWHSFVTDSQNRIASAAGEPGVCPAPGSAEYTPGLSAFSYCIQLTIQDGGPNDADGVRDFVVRDPGGVSVSDAESAAVAEADDRLGILSPLTLLVLIALGLMISSSRRQR